MINSSSEGANSHPAPILYGHPESGHTYKVALTLELAGIPFDYRWVDVFRPRNQRGAEFQAASRYGEIPVLVDDGQPMAQSNAILLHLAGKHRLFGGESAASLAQAREWLFLEANRIGISLPNLRHYLRFADTPASPEVLDWLRGRMQSDLQRLEQEFAAKTWLVGAGPGVADIACFAYLCYDDIKLDLAEFPRVRDWMQRMRDLPRWRHPFDLLAKPA